MSTVFDLLDLPFTDWHAEAADRAVDALPAVLVARSTPRGGEYSLDRAGDRETVSPVRSRFGEVRAVAHVPLAVHAVARLDLEHADQDARRRLLVDAVDAAAPPVRTWPEPERSAAQRVLAAGRATADPGSGPLDAAAAEHLLSRTRADLDVLVGTAASAQAQDCSALLARWRTELGESVWSRLQAVVGVAPAQRGTGTHTAVLTRALGGDPVGDGRLVLVAGVREPAALRHRLGVALLNRTLAGALYGDTRHLEEDLMTGPVTAALPPAT